MLVGPSDEILPQAMSDHLPRGILELFFDFSKHHAGHLSASEITTDFKESSKYFVELQQKNEQRLKGDGLKGDVKLVQSVPVRM
ncbi:hypothetical protein AVEN_252595-1 [Araneus ventricosus]|uniref:Uncharacterized protein n=1 Tax=Araneus ventricosus TaxID=182803 RepID=A0A4Y2ATF5_ARAVE|nr:hypothetical protein AVEN_252595-1 [Araneus ventricosus]